MRLAPRATMHAPLAFGAAAAQRSWMYHLPAAPQQHFAGYPGGAMLPGAGSMYASPPLMGHRPVEPPVTYAAPMMIPMHQPCMQQMMYYGSAPEPSPAHASATSLSAPTTPAGQFSRQVIQLPPAVSERSAPEAKPQVGFSSTSVQDVDFDLAPPPPPPACAPTLPHSCAPSRHHPAMPPPPSASPRVLGGVVEPGEKGFGS